MKVLRIQKWYINTSNILYILWKVNKPILPDYLLSAQHQTESLQGSPNDDVSRGSFIHFLQIIEGDLSKMLFSTNNIKLTVINLKICQWSHKVLFFKCIRWFFGSDILFVPRKCPFNTYWSCAVYDLICYSSLFVLFMIYLTIFVSIMLTSTEVFHHVDCCLGILTVYCEFLLLVLFRVTFVILSLRQCRQWWILWVPEYKTSLWIKIYGGANKNHAFRQWKTTGPQ